MNYILNKQYEYVTQSQPPSIDNVGFHIKSYRRLGLRSAQSSGPI